MLKDLLISKTRVKLLTIFLANVGKIFYVRELVRMTNEQINAVRAELTRLEKAGALFSENRANRKFYGFRKDYQFFDELLRMVAKSTGLGGSIIKERGKLGKIKYAVLSGGFIRRRPVGSTDVDLLIVTPRGNWLNQTCASLFLKSTPVIGLGKLTGSCGVPVIKVPLGETTEVAPGVFFGTDLKTSPDRKTY